MNFLKYTMITSVRDRNKNLWDYKTLCFSHRELKNNQFFLQISQQINYKVINPLHDSIPYVPILDLNRMARDNSVKSKKGNTLYSQVDDLFVY
jgi:hypothetical protein